MQFHSYYLPSLCLRNSLSAVHNALPRRERKTVQFLPFVGLIYRLSHLSKLLLFSWQRWIPLESSVLSYEEVLAALTSESSWVVTLLGAVALGYNTYETDGTKL